VNKRNCWISILLILSAVSVFSPACSETMEKEDDSRALVLRSYQVPPEYASEVSSIISLLLRNAGGEPIGTARIGPGSLLLVTAPASIHSGIREMIANIEKARPEPPPMVSLDYWIVVGRPSNETLIPAELKAIEPALKAVVESEGARAFSLGERLKLRSLSGQKAAISGRMIDVSQEATIREDKVLGNIKITRRVVGTGFSTDIQMNLGKILIVGQSGFGSEAGRPPARAKTVAGDSEDDSDTSIYYIVRSESDQ